VLFCFPKRLFVRRLDTYEDVLKVGEPHQLHELIVLGEIERGFCEERKRIGALLLPTDNVAKDWLYRFLVADEVVVDDKDNPKPSVLERLKLG